MAFENFPYTNFHEINLDWIVSKVKEAYSASNPPDYPVKSVNGMTGDVIIAIPANLVQSVNGETGDVILYRNPLVQFPTTNESRWNLFRICDGDERGIEFDEDGAHRIEGTRRILIYDEENQPNYPVTSVNGQTGDVRITAGVNSVNGKTGNVVTPFVNPNTDILKLDSNSSTVLWGISRDVAGGNVALYISRGTGIPQAFIRYIPDGGEPVNLPLLSSADIPAEAGVISVNSKTGAVTLYGTDIAINDSSTTSISEQLGIVTQNMETILDSIITHEANTELWARGSMSAETGSNSTSSTRIRTITYVPENCLKITTNRENLVFRLYAWDAEENYIGMWQTSNEFLPSSDNIAGLASIDFSYFEYNYPGYKYRVVALFRSGSTISVSEAENIFFEYSKLVEIEGNEENIRNDITALQAKDTTHDQQISDLNDADTQLAQDITALQAKDTTHDQQIAALQAADSTHNQQIAELQSADATHNQQIAELQAKDNTQDQQISELYTKTGVYVVSISNANTLPFRFPASGTDSKIKDTNKVVYMDLSYPGAQMSDWTITTYEGYLEITGTISGQTDVTLYLA